MPVISKTKPMRWIGMVVALCALGLLLGLVASAQQPAVVRIGFTESESGAYASLSQRQANGLRLWITDIDAARGIELSDGAFVAFETVSCADESASNLVTEGYTRLVLEDRVDFLVSPYASDPASAAAAVADANGAILITAGAAAESTPPTQGYMHVYLVHSPSTTDLYAAVGLLRSLLLPPPRIAFVAEDGSFARHG